MAQFYYATKDISISNAKAFLKLINETDTVSEKNSIILYAVLGRNKPWPNEPVPSVPPDNEQYFHFDSHREFIGGKRIDSEDVSHVVDRHDWISGTVYSMFRDTDVDMYERPFYILTDEYNVYKCLYNNKGSQSIVKPTGFSILPFSTSDGYTWKYMYTINLSQVRKFLTSDYMPVQFITSSDGSGESDRQLAVQNAAVNGAINVIETVTTGSNYRSIENVSVEAGGINTLKLSGVDAVSSEDNFYNGETLYVISGTGAGQLRRIIDYSGNSRTLVVNSAFTTVCNTDTKVVISPTITIIGDGYGAKAYCKVNDGAISNVAIIDTGRNYTRAEAIITANSIHGFGASANVVISPVGGHGSDPIRELYADKLMINVQIGANEGESGTGKGYIPSNTQFRTVSIWKDPILKVDQNNDHITDEVVAKTTNSPSSIRLCDRLTISYSEMDGLIPQNPIEVGNTLINQRNYNRCLLGTAEFVTDLGAGAREVSALVNAKKAANGDVVYIRKAEEYPDDPSIYTAYINNVESYGQYLAFTNDDIILKSTNETPVADTIDVKGPEANTFSGEILFTQNVYPVTRTPEQTEDIKIVLDF